MRALDMLKADHRKVKSLFKSYEQLSGTEVSRKRALFQQIQSELRIHAEIEEKIFYPAVNELPGEKVRDRILLAGEEHAGVKTMLSELEDTRPEDPLFDARMKLLRESVERHIEEEEDEIFVLAKKLGKERLREVSEEMELVRKLSGRAA